MERRVWHAPTLHFNNSCPVPRTMCNKRWTVSGLLPLPLSTYQGPDQLHPFLALLQDIPLGPSLDEGWLEDAKPLA